MSELDDFEKRNLAGIANAVRLNEQKKADSTSMDRQRNEDSRRSREQKDADALRYYEVLGQNVRTTYEEANLLAAQRNLKLDNDPSYGGVKRGLEQQRNKSGGDEYYVQHSRDVKSQYEQQQTLLERAMNEPDKTLTANEWNALQKEANNFFAKKEKAYEDLRTASMDSKIEAGTAQVVDKQFFEISEKGNTKFQVAFWEQARHKGAAMYQVHLDRQDELAKRFTEAEKLGDKELATSIRDRQEYEALAYDRDRGLSYLASCEVMYGKDSKQYKEQEADVKELSELADNAHAKLQVSLNALNERDQAQKLEAEQAQLEPTTQKLEQKPSSDQNQSEKQLADTDHAQIERLQKSEADMRQEQQVAEQQNHATNLQKLQEIGPLVPSRLEDYEKSKSDLNAFLTREERVQRAREEGREVSKSEVRGDKLHTPGDAADREAKADARLQQIEQEHLKADAQKPDARKDEQSDQSEMKKEDPALDQQRQAERKAELDKALKDGREGQAQFKQQVQQGIDEREQRQDANREHFSGRIGELRQAKENLDNSEGRSALQNLKAQDEFNQVANRISSDLKERENFSKEMIAMKEHGNAMIKANDPAAVKHHTEKFEASYKKLDSMVSKAEGNEKGYAANMRQQLDSGVKKLESQEQQVVAERQQQRESHPQAITRPSIQKQPADAKLDHSDVAKKHDVQTASQANAQKAPEQARTTKQEASAVEAKKAEQGLDKKAEQSAQQQQKPAENKAEEGNRVSGSVKKVQEAKANKQAEGKSDNQAVEARKAEVERQIKEEKARQAAQQTEDQTRRRR